LLHCPLALSPLSPSALGSGGGSSGRQWSHPPPVADDEGQTKRILAAAAALVHQQLRGDPLRLLQDLARGQLRPHDRVLIGVRAVGGGPLAPLPATGRAVVVVLLLLLQLLLRAAFDAQSVVRDDERFGLRRCRKAALVDVHRESVPAGPQPVPERAHQRQAVVLGQGVLQRVAEVHQGGVVRGGHKDAGPPLLGDGDLQRVLEGRRHAVEAVAELGLGGEVAPPARTSPGTALAGGGGL